MPVLLEQHQGLGEVVEFPSFDAAVDEYYIKFEERKLVVAADAAERAIKQKVEKIRKDQEKVRLATGQRPEPAPMPPCPHVPDILRLHGTTTCSG